MLRVAIVLWIAAMPAAGWSDTIVHTEHRYQLELEAGFSKLAPVLATGAGTVIVERWQGDDATLSVVRVNYPNRRAWRGQRAFFAEVEDGVRKESTDYKRLLKHQFKAGRVPGLDLHYRRAGADRPQVVLSRFLFFRTYTLVMSMSTTSAGYRKHRKAFAGVVQSFKPYFN